MEIERNESTKNTRFFYLFDFHDGIPILPYTTVVFAQLLKKQGPLADRSLSWEEIPDPAPGPGQILIRVSACAVCHTDLHIVEGEVPASKLPIIPGHQAVGRVIGIGSGVSDWRIGDRAGIPWLHSTCGKCRFCREGKENLCADATFTGRDHHGGYAEAIVTEAAFTIPLRSSLDDAHVAPLLCAGIIGYRAYRIAKVEPGDTLGLVGFGASAHLTLPIARKMGMRVFVFSRSSEHRLHAMQLGAEWAGALEQAPPSKLDSAIVFAPSGELIPPILDKIRPGGKLVINAIYMSPIPVIPYPSLYQERTITTIANATREDAREFFDLAERVSLRPEITTFPMREANQALRLLRDSQINGAGVLLADKPKG